MLKRGRTRYGSGMTLTLADRLLRLNSETRRQAASFLGGGRPVPAVVLMTDTHRGNPLRAAQALPAGAAVLIRNYDDPDRDRLAGRLAAIARRRRLVLMLAVRTPAVDLDLAHRIGACGLHLPEGILRSVCLTRLRQWRLARSDRFITAAAHSLTAVLRARRAGVDAVLVSPVFPTLSHPGAPVLGLRPLRACVRYGRIPVLALGGLSVSTVKALTGSGVWGGAAISGLGPYHGRGRAGGP